MAGSCVVARPLVVGAGVGVVEVDDGRRLTVVALVRADEVGEGRVVWGLAADVVLHRKANSNVVLHIALACLCMYLSFRVVEVTGFCVVGLCVVAGLVRGRVCVPGPAVVVTDDAGVLKGHVHVRKRKQYVRT